MDFDFDESSTNETIDAFLNAVGTSDLAMMDAVPLLDLWDDTSDASAEGDDAIEDKGGSEEGMNVILYTDSDDEEMDFKFGRCRGDCLSHLEEFYTTSSTKALIGDPNLSSVGSSLRSDNPLTMDYDEEEEVDHHQAQLKASREIFGEWRDLEDKELDKYLKNERKVKEQKQVAEIAIDDSDVDIEGITDASSNSGSDVDIENVNPRLSTEIRADTNQHSAGSNVLGNSITTLNFRNYAMCPESQFYGKPQAPSTSSFMTSSQRPSKSSFNTSSTSTQVPHAPARRGRPSTAGGAAPRGRPSTAGGAAGRGRPSTAGGAARRGRPITTGGVPQRGRPPLASSARRRRSAQLVAAAIRRPVVFTEAVRNLRATVTPMNLANGSVRRQDRLNEMERGRRRKLSDLLETLRRNVPDTAIMDRASKVLILNSAVAYIKRLRVREKEQKFEISTEMTRQKELLRELKKLK